MMFSFSLWREGRVGTKTGDKFQPTRDKEATSQKCAWGKGIRHRGEEEGALLRSHPTSRDSFSSLSTSVPTKGAGGPGCRVLSAPLCLGQNSEHSGVSPPRKYCWPTKQVVLSLKGQGRQWARKTCSDSLTMSCCRGGGGEGGRGGGGRGKGEEGGGVFVCVCACRGICQQS